MSSSSITDLADHTAREAVAASTVAEICGDWITGQQPCVLRPLWADVAQSHSWYFQMWSQRYPVIPGRDLTTELASPPEETQELVLATRQALSDSEEDQSRLRVMTTLVIPATLRRIETLNTQIDRALDAPTAIIIDRVQMDLNRLLYAASRC
jgi:hypothetical protein